MAVLAVLVDAGTALFFEVTLRQNRAGGFCRRFAATTFLNTWNVAADSANQHGFCGGRLESLAGKDDLMVINPFFFGVSFADLLPGPDPGLPSRS